MTVSDCSYIEDVSRNEFERKYNKATSNLHLHIGGFYVE
jgi:hypothetical protein